MFDARSILDALVAGSSEQTRTARESGGLNDIMGDLLGQLKKAGEAAPSGSVERDDPYRRYEEERRSEPTQTRSRNPLEDLFGQLGGGGSLQYEEQAAPRSLEQRQPDRSGNQTEPRSSAQPDYGDLLERVKELVGNNKTAAGAIVGGLGGLLLGTKTGRSLVGRAARLGGLALIGTLAYKAYKNYQQDAPSQGGQGDDDRFGVPELPPEGSGYEADAMTNDDAALFIRTMVAAAASDGQIDRQEQRTILGNLEQAGMDGEAMDFLASEFNDPASIEDIIDSVRSQEQAVKVYTAARIAIEPDTQDEQRFLSSLSRQLGLDSALAAQIDETAYSIKVR